MPPVDPSKIIASNTELQREEVVNPEESPASAVIAPVAKPPWLDLSTFDMSAWQTLKDGEKYGLLVLVNPVKNDGMQLARVQRLKAGGFAFLGVRPSDGVMAFHIERPVFTSDDIMRWIAGCSPQKFKKTVRYGMTDTQIEYDPEQFDASVLDPVDERDRAKLVRHNQNKQIDAERKHASLKRSAIRRAAKSAAKSAGLLANPGEARDYWFTGKNFSWMDDGKIGCKLNLVGKVNEVYSYNIDGKQVVAIKLSSRDKCAVVRFPAYQLLDPDPAVTTDTSFKVNFPVLRMLLSLRDALQSTEDANIIFHCKTMDTPGQGNILIAVRGVGYIAPATKLDKHIGRYRATLLIEKLVSEVNASLFKAECRTKNHEPLDADAQSSYFPAQQ